MCSVECCTKNGCEPFWFIQFNVNNARLISHGTRQNDVNMECGMSDWSEEEKKQQANDSDQYLWSLFTNNTQRIGFFLGILRSLHAVHWTDVKMCLFFKMKTSKNVRSSKNYWLLYTHAHTYALFLCAFFSKVIFFCFVVGAAFFGKSFKVFSSISISIPILLTSSCTVDGLIFRWVSWASTGFTHVLRTWSTKAQHTEDETNWEKRKNTNHFYFFSLFFRECVAGHFDGFIMILCNL